jgi:hypothetical protein
MQICAATPVTIKHRPPVGHSLNTEPEETEIEKNGRKFLINLWMLRFTPYTRADLMGLRAVDCFKVDRISCCVWAQFPHMGERKSRDHHFLWVFVSKSQTMPWRIEPGRIVAKVDTFLPDDTADVETITVNPGVCSQNRNNSASNGSNRSQIRHN